MNSSIFAASGGNVFPLYVLRARAWSLNCTTFPASNSICMFTRQRTDHLFNRIQSKLDQPDYRQTRVSPSATDPISTIDIDMRAVPPPPPLLRSCAGNLCGLGRSHNSRIAPKHFNSAMSMALVHRESAPCHRNIGYPQRVKSVTSSARDHSAFTEWNLVETAIWSMSVHSLNARQIEIEWGTN